MIHCQHHYALVQEFPSQQEVDDIDEMTKPPKGGGLRCKYSPRGLHFPSLDSDLLSSPCDNKLHARSSFDDPTIFTVANTTFPLPPIVNDISTCCQYKKVPPGYLK
mmetsp:Transcript_8901/g.14800  ORF Transcript_8901/g.14800 Transcript_8901/m.14800 type:complete len:106 (-) Transcript_8901:75-392(-)